MSNYNNNNDGGCLGAIVVFVIIVLLFKFIAAIGVLIAIGVLTYLLYRLVKFLIKYIGKKNEENFVARKEMVVTEIGNKISHKKEIQQSFDKHFEKIERQFSLVTLISLCTGNNNQELKNLLNSSQETAFKSTEKEIFGKLSPAEQKRFPESVKDVVEYKKTLEQESKELSRDLASVTCANEEHLYEMMQKHCPELHKRIKHKRRKLIASIVVPTTVIIVLSIILSSGFAFSLAKGYHQTVLEEKLNENNITSCSIYNITYEENSIYSWDEDDAVTHDITDVRLKYNDNFSNHSEEELRKILQQLYRKLNVNITYRWAQHNLSFKTDKYDYNIILIDNTGESCSYDGKYFDIDK